MSVVVLRAGPATSVQDLGRFGWRHLGVGAGGALDAFSARVANLMVGNDDGAAVLEIALAGPLLRFERGARIALAGASIDARASLLPTAALDARASVLPAAAFNASANAPPAAALDARRHSRSAHDFAAASATAVTLPGWRAIDLPAGSELRLGGCRDGARAYLAVRGGFEVERVLGSRATDLRAGFGGVEGRALRSGDRLQIAGDNGIDTLRIAPWWIDPTPDLDLARDAVVHLIADAGTPPALFATDWRTSAASDRQGLRLEGAALAAATRERVSAPVAPGTVQLPPDGRPIVLLAEAQTVGGYPVIGQVATADLPRLAQCRPGDAVRFVAIDREAALGRLRAQCQRIERMRLALRYRSA